jgi:general secretion pathway protein A
MYLEYYGLRKEPFHITPDPEFLYLSPSHKEALGVIVYGVENRAGFMMITGGVGLGKTTILRSAIQQFDSERIKTVLVFNPCISYADLVKLIYEELGLGLREGDDPFQIIQGLHLALIEEYKRGNHVILIIDEAQNMPVETLENLRMLSNLETNKDKLIQIILVGQQPELDHLLNTDALRQLKQRISHRATLVKLTKKESADYIRHRLNIALAVKKSPFTKAASNQIVNHCDGVPRCINIVCNNALVSGYGSSQNPIKPALVREVIGDLEGRQTRSWKRWVLLPIALVLLASLLLYFYAPGKIFSLKGLRGTTAVSREQAEVTRPPDKPQDSPQKTATSGAVERASGPSRMETRPQSTSPAKPDAASSSGVPGQPSGASPGAAGTSQPSQPSSSASVEGVRGTGSRPSSPLESKPESKAVAVAPPEKRPAKPETVVPGTDSALVLPSQGSVPGPGVSTKQEALPLEKSAVATVLPAKAPPATEASNSASAMVEPGAAEKLDEKPVGASTQVPPAMKTEAQPSRATPSTAALDKPSEKAGSPDPSEIIDWLIEKRAKGKGSGAN